MPAKPAIEGEVFYPSAEVVAQARVKDWDALARRALDDVQRYTWLERARKAMQGFLTTNDTNKSNNTNDQ